MNGKRETGVATGAFHHIRRKWSPGDVVVVSLPMRPRSSRWFNDSVALDVGPLVFSLKIGEDWHKLRDRGPTADWELLSLTPWNYALELNEANLSDSVAISRRDVAGSRFPFSPDGAPISLKVKGRRVPAWKMQDGSAAPPPQSPVTSEQPLEELTLIPYGAAKLRITEFPVLEQ